MNAAPTVGVLALQGASAPHREAFARLGVATREVRAPHELEGLTHLVLPGGESTTLHHLLVLFDLWQPIADRHRAGELALFGTCAGAILLARDCGEKPPTLGLLDAELERNAYGRQIDSFTREITLADEAIQPRRSFPAVFIRAPRISAVGAGVRVLARDGEQPLALEAPGLLACTFHPELTDDPWFHERFLAMSAAAAG